MSFILATRSCLAFQVTSFVLELISVVPRVHSDTSWGWNSTHEISSIHDISQSWKNLPFKNKQLSNFRLRWSCNIMIRSQSMFNGLKWGGYFVWSQNYSHESSWEQLAISLESPPRFPSPPPPPTRTLQLRSSSCLWALFNWFNYRALIVSWHLDPFGGFIGRVRTRKRFKKHWHPQEATFLTQSHELTSQWTLSLSSASVHFHHPIHPKSWG